jgi:hypothetical protein
MSADLKAEEDMYKAIKQVAELPRHSVKMRIYKESIETICNLAGWSLDTKDISASE